MGRRHRLTTRTRGHFVTFEGGEGAGKSTQVLLLGEALRRSGREKPVLTREPGGSAGAEDIRRLLVTGNSERWDGVTEALLHCAARRDHLIRTIWPALVAGRWVLCDRFADSMHAYQGSGHGVAEARLHDLTALVAGDFRPDVTIILDLPPQMGLERAHAALRGKGGERRYEHMGLSFHHRVRQAFQTIAAAEPVRCIVVDASGNISDVHAAVRRAVAERLGVDLPDARHLCEWQSGMPSPERPT